MVFYVYADLCSLLAVTRQYSILVGQNMQLTGCHNGNDMCNATCADTQISVEWLYCHSLYCGLEKCSISLVGIFMTSICKVVPMSVLLEMLLIQLKPLTALVFKARIKNGNAFSMFFPIELFVTSHRENN